MLCLVDNRFTIVNFRLIFKKPATCTPPIIFPSGKAIFLSDFTFYLQRLKRTVYFQCEKYYNILNKSASIRDGTQNYIINHNPINPSKYYIVSMMLSTLYSNDVAPIVANKNSKSTTPLEFWWAIRDS